MFPSQGKRKWADAEPEFSLVAATAVCRPLFSLSPSSSPHLLGRARQWVRHCMRFPPDRTPRERWSKEIRTADFVCVGLFQCVLSVQCSQCPQCPKCAHTHGPLHRAAAPPPTSSFDAKFTHLGASCTLPLLSATATSARCRLYFTSCPLHQFSPTNTHTLHFPPLPLYTTALSASQSSALK